MLLNREELENVSMHSSCREAEPLDVSLAFQVSRIRGKKRPQSLSLFAKLEAKAAHFIQSWTWGLPRDLPLLPSSGPGFCPSPRLFRYTGREAGICPLPGYLMAVSFPRPLPWPSPLAATPSGPAASTACIAATGGNAPKRGCKPARWSGDEGRLEVRRQW
jgi:hypothetical protein